MALIKVKDVKISIHALREEGDIDLKETANVKSYFYPRPPRGGRRQGSGSESSTGSISIHALREEGDTEKSMHRAHPKIFLSTPSARRATCQRSHRNG